MSTPIEALRAAREEAARHGLDYLDDRIVFAADPHIRADERAKNGSVPLIRQLVEELEDLAKASCWRGNFAACDNGGCVHRRALIAEARRLLFAAGLTGP